MTGRIVVVGSGSLAHSICYSLAVVLKEKYRVSICARSREKCDEIRYVATAKAVLFGSPVVFDSFRFDAQTDDAGELIDRLKPDLLLSCTSYHSPWEGRSQPSCWTELLARAGFGMTLPLQAAFAIKLARAVAESPRTVLFINGCYPDAVNPVLKALNLPVLCGIGNVAVIAATLQAGLDITDRRRLRVLAHHLHLNDPGAGAEEAQAWIDGAKCERVSDLLQPQRTTDGLEVNGLTGFTAAILLRDILEGRRIETCVPGPHGRPGGYPVLIEGLNLALNLPADISESAAIEWNQKCAVADGVKVLSLGCVEFSARVKLELSRFLPEIAGSFHASQMAGITHAMLQLREWMRKIPSADWDTLRAAT
jgi:hypothetical protein